MLKRHVAHDGAILRFLMKTKIAGRTVTSSMGHVKQGIKSLGAWIAPRTFDRIRVQRTIRVSKGHVSALLDKKLEEMGFQVNPGDQIVDLGANFGLVSEYFLEKGAIVHAYEPNPYCANILNRLSVFTNFVLYNEAAAAVRTRAPLYFSNNYDRDPIFWSCGSTLSSKKSDYSESNVLVDCVDIPTVLARMPHVKLLKVDIEGGEYAIYEDIIDNIENIEFVLMETHADIPGVKRMHNEMIEAIANAGLDRRFKTDWV